MNYDTLLSAAHDYISAYNDVRRTFPYGFTLWDSTLLHSEAAQKSICHDRYEAVFHALCECAGINGAIELHRERYCSRIGVVAKAVKSTNTVWIEFPDSDRYGAYPENILPA